MQSSTNVIRGCEAVSLRPDWSIGRVWANRIFAGERMAAFAVAAATLAVLAWSLLGMSQALRHLTDAGFDGAGFGAVAGFGSY